MGRLAYDPYGQLVDSAGPQPPLRYRWTGREWDAETGFYFHRTRVYDPAVGRFVQEDRAGYGGGGNLYAYVEGNVLQARDPDGRLGKDPYPDYCCGRWAQQWDGWFGISGSLLGVPVTYGTAFLYGDTYHFVVRGRGGLGAGVTFVDIGLGRQLSRDEIVQLGQLCGAGGAPCGSITLFTGISWTIGHRALTLGRFIFLPWKSVDVGNHIPDLAHEVTHTLQFELLGFQLALDILSTEQLQYMSHEGRTDPMNPYNWFSQWQAQPGKPFWSFTLEGQAELVADCFRQLPLACSISPFGPPQ